MRGVLGRRARGFRLARRVERVHRFHASVDRSVRNAHSSVTGRLLRFRALPLALREERPHARRLHQRVRPRLASAHDVVEDLRIRVATRRESRVERAHAAVRLGDRQRRPSRQGGAPRELRHAAPLALLHVADHGVEHALELHEQAARDAALLAHDGGHRARVQGDAQLLQGRLMWRDVRMMERWTWRMSARRGGRAKERKPGEPRVVGLTEPNDVSRGPRSGGARLVGARARRLGATANRARVRRRRGGCLDEVPFRDVPVAW